MNNNYKFSFLLHFTFMAILLVFVSCTRSSVMLTTNFKGCNFEYQNKRTDIKWTAYKFLNKVGVQGNFTEHSVQGIQKVSIIKNFIQQASFTIPVSGINSNNSVRDEKIKKYLFQQMEKTENIKGNILSIDGQNIKIAISLNGVSRIINGKVLLNMDKTSIKEMKKNIYNVQIKSSIDLEDFDARNAVSALNNACKELHTGVDGESILWPTVDLNINFYLQKVCS